MKFFDWLKNLGKPKSADDALVSSDVSAEPKRKNRRVQLAAENPAVPGSRRRVLQDERYLPKPVRKNYWERPDPVLDDGTAARMFAPGMRTRNRVIRTLASDVDLLAERGLPTWQDELALVADLGITAQRLWWLASHRYDDRITHYTRFRVPKRRGGYRTIMAPKVALKAVQRLVLKRLASRLPVSDYAHGFVPGRSVRTNAEPHVGRRVVLRFDLEDFFGTVTFGRVRGYLIAMGYSFAVATALALLMTEAERQPVEVDGELRYVPIGHRYCVQGAPTSPAVCNAIASKLDHRLAGLGAAHGFVYTRYADDLTFSGDDESKIGLLLRMVKQIVVDEGFRLNAEKTRVMRSGSRQSVTGVIVNETLGLSRTRRREMRARIHRMSPASPPEELRKLRGELAYLQMLNPAQAEALRPEWLKRGSNP